MRRMIGILVITVHGQLGGTGPPFGHETRLLKEPMMSLIQEAQRATVLLSPDAHLNFLVGGPFHPPLAPLSFVFIRRKNLMLAVAW